MVQRPTEPLLISEQASIMNNCGQRVRGHLSALRLATVFIAGINVLAVVMGCLSAEFVLQKCDYRSWKFPVLMVSVGAGLKMVTMVASGMSQRSAAVSIVSDISAGILAGDGRQLRMIFSSPSIRQFTLITNPTFIDRLMTHLTPFSRFLPFQVGGLKSEEKQWNILTSIELPEKGNPRQTSIFRRLLSHLRLAPSNCNFPQRRSRSCFFSPITTRNFSAVDRMYLLLNRIQSLRFVTLIFGIGNVGLVLLGTFLMAIDLFGCPAEVKLPFAVVSLVAVIRIICVIGSGLAQVATAATIVNYPEESSDMVDAVIRQERRMRYRRWLWWTRFGMGVTVLQSVGALYLTIVVAKNLSYDAKTTECFLGSYKESSRKWILVISFVSVSWLVVVVQCFMGTDVLRWRSFYATHDTAWKAHYLEVFDHGIREALCCLGRLKYMSVLEEDEVYSVARLLGDLVSYRATGTGHLEFLAGLALLQRRSQSQPIPIDLHEAPQTRIEEAATYHPFAEAAYTGPLLDFGRNPVLFPFAWLHRQGILYPWARNRRPVLEGDNWWRGHAAAFLKYVNLPPDALRRGRVHQSKREAAYFIVVLHQIRTVVIAVRGTETPEDLLTDVLCRECVLTEDDLDGLINCDYISMEIRRKVLSSGPHYGHSGIVESARELFMQIDGTSDTKDGCPSETTGFLSTLMEVGQECHGYKICIVGHSLGGSVATLLGIRLYRRYPNLHVYSYGTLPCVDLIVAEACASFVTSIVYNDEFSARLSINSIIRLQAASIAALSDDSSANSDIISKLARRFLHVNGNREKNERHSCSTSIDPSKTEREQPCRRNFKYTVKGGGFLCAHAFSCVVNMPAKCNCSSQWKTCPEVLADATLEADVGESSFVAEADKPIQNVFSCEESSLVGCSNFNSGHEEFDKFNNGEFYMHNFKGSEDMISSENHRPDNSAETSVVDPPEMFLPGLIIHFVPEERNILPLWKTWTLQDKKLGYRALIAKRENFKDIVVTPYMFLDHLPWRCHYAMQRVIERRKVESRLHDNLLNGIDVV